MSAKVWEEFLTQWPREKLAEMTLEGFCGPGDDTFQRWVEVRTDSLGGLGGSEAAKWGIQLRAAAAENREVSGFQSDAKFIWHGGLGGTAQAAFQRVRDVVIRIADLAAEGDLTAVDAVDGLGPVLRWKIAFLYQDRAAARIVGVFRADALRNALAVFEPDGDAERRTKLPMSGLYADIQRVLGTVGDLHLIGHLVTQAPQLAWLTQVARAERVWEVGAGEGGRLRQWWSDASLISIGWSFGDLTGLTRSDFQARAEAKGVSTKSSRDGVWQLWEFQNDMQAGDVVLARDRNQSIFAIGIIESACRFEPEATAVPLNRLSHPYIRRVRWLNRQSFMYPWTTQRTVGYRSKADVFKLVAMPLLETTRESVRAGGGAPSAVSLVRNVILSGPPGTGKTWSLKSRAVRLLEQLLRDGPEPDRTTLDWNWSRAMAEGRAEFVTFHPSTTYDEFIEGLRPSMGPGGAIQYTTESGVFKRIALRAISACADGEAPMPADGETESMAEQEARGQRLLDEGRPLDFTEAPAYVLVIDEINRANISRVFGELITLLEEDKRLGGGDELRLTLPTSQRTFAVPPNLFVIGTMNTADRSIALLDVALRRRFVFDELMPDPKVLTKMLAGTPEGFAAEVVRIFEMLNARLTFMLDREHVVGHAWFGRAVSWDALRAVFAEKVIPLLQEYFAGAPDRMAIALGHPFDEKRQKPQDADLQTRSMVCVRTITETAAFGRSFPDLDDVQEVTVHPLFVGRGDFKFGDGAGPSAREIWIRETFRAAFPPVPAP